MDNACQKLGRGVKPVRYHLWGQSPVMRYFALYTKNVKGSFLLVSNPYFVKDSLIAFYTPSGVLSDPVRAIVLLIA